MRKKYNVESGNVSLSNEEYLRKKEVLASFFLDRNYELMTFKQIKGVFNITKKEDYILEKILDELQQEGRVYIDDSKRYVPTASKNIYVGIYEAKSSNFGFVRIEDNEDIYVSSEYSMNAMDKDKVLVKKISSKTEEKNAEGQVIKIIERNIKTVIGRFQKSRNYGFVESIDNKMNDIYIPKKYAKDVEDNQMVKVELLKYPINSNKAEGKIVQVIGSIDDENIDVKALNTYYNIENRKQFPSDVCHEISKIKDTVSSEDFVGRKDKTNENIYTIDGEDAKDLDDGVSVKKLDDGNYLLSVYIADVSHYVKDKTRLNEEAISRGTSIYIPGTVVPMLPKKLSNGICSLNEGVDRLALAIDIKIDKEGEVIESDIYKAVINVKKRMTYENVYKVLSLEDKEGLKEYEPFKQDLFLMQELALILNVKRISKGSINFDIPETKVVLDENGKVIEIKPYEITIANKIIEEFMLVANMQVAEKFFYLDLPFIYRIHEKPDDERLRELNEVLYNYGKKIKGIKNIHPKTLADIINSITDEEEKQVVSNYMLRCLKLARYSEECIGHFGLAAKYYCHFTSPIRRYPDLFIHRVISDYIDNGYVLSDEKIEKYKIQAQKYAKISSEMEKEATQVERDFDDLYKAIYMERFIDKDFSCVVSSITSFGMFVKLANTVEGLIPFSNINDNDYYIFDEKRRILVGKNTGEIFRVGDKLKVKLVRCDIKTKQIDFEFVSREVKNERKQEKSSSKKAGNKGKNKQKKVKGEKATKKAN